MPTKRKCMICRNTFKIKSYLQETNKKKRTWFCKKCTKLEKKCQIK